MINEYKTNVNDFPVVKFSEKQISRIRIIKDNSIHSGLHYKSVKQHVSSDERNMPVACISKSNGCIFHADPFSWDLKDVYFANVAFYSENETCHPYIMLGKEKFLALERAMDRASVPYSDIHKHDFLVQSAKMRGVVTYSARIAANRIDEQDFITIESDAVESDLTYSDNFKLYDYTVWPGSKISTREEQMNYFGSVYDLDEFCDVVKKPETLIDGQVALPPPSPVVQDTTTVDDQLRMEFIEICSKSEFLCTNEAIWGILNSVSPNKALAEFDSLELAELLDMARQGDIPMMLVVERSR